MSWEWNSQFCLNLSRHFCSYKNYLNIDLYTFFRNLKHVVSKYTYRRVHKDLKIVHDWRSQSLYLIPRNINQLNKPDNHRAPLVWENVLVLAGLEMRESVKLALSTWAILGQLPAFPSCASGPLSFKFNNLDGKNGSWAAHTGEDKMDRRSCDMLSLLSSLERLQIYCQLQNVKETGNSAPTGSL